MDFFDEVYRYYLVYKNLYKKLLNSTFDIFYISYEFDVKENEDFIKTKYNKNYIWDDSLKLFDQYEKIGMILHNSVDTYYKDTGLDSLQNIFRIKAGMYDAFKSNLINGFIL